MNLNSMNEQGDRWAMRIVSKSRTPFTERIKKDKARSQKEWCRIIIQYCVPRITQNYPELHPAVEIDLSKKSFLIVDDHQAMRNGIAEMLYSSGADDVDKAARGGEAITRLKERRYDAVLCDYNLGRGKNGQQVLEEVKFRKFIPYSTVFIMISGDSSLAVVMGAMEYKPDDYLTKPFPKELVITRLNRHFGRKQIFKTLDRALSAGLFMKALEQCTVLLGQANKRNRMELLKLQSDLFLEVGDYDQASIIFCEVLMDRRAPWAQVGQARVYYYKERYELAEKLLTQVIEELPSTLDAYDWLSKTHLAQGDKIKAEAVLEQAVELSPKAILRHQTLARLAERNGSIDLAEQSFRNAIQLGQNSIHRHCSDDSKLAGICGKRGRSEEALEIIKSMRYEFKGDVEAELRAMMAETVIFQEKGDEKRAKESLLKSLALAGQSDQVLPSEVALDLARMSYLSGDKKTAEKLIHDLVRQNIDGGLVLDDLKAICKELGLESLIEESISEARKEVIKINNEGVRLFDEGKVQEAIRHLERAIEGMPGNKTVLMNMVKIMLHDMKTSGADKRKLNRTKRYIDRAVKLGLPGDKLKDSLTEFHRLMNVA